MRVQEVDKFKKLGYHSWVCTASVLVLVSWFETGFFSVSVLVNSNSLILYFIQILSFP